MVIDYYFSVLSDWAYFGGERVERVARRYGATVNHMPIRLATIYAGTGGILLQERSKQRQDYRVVELARWRDYLGIPINIFPRYYPTNDAIASQAIIAAKRLGANVGPLANAILRAIWAEDRDISDPETLRRIADGLGLDGAALLEMAGDSDIVEEFDRYTREAQERGVFGSPFYMLGDEVFWGQDRLEFLEEALARAAERSSIRPLIRASQNAKD